MSVIEQEINEGKRFQFGKNWRSFLETLDDERVSSAEESIRSFLDIENLDGKKVLDIGSGSGLFSLAARNLGASVVSFDFDPASVQCTEELRKRFYGNDPDWSVMNGSVLDKHFLSELGQFDVVYSWGVLHHTGDMWAAIENAVNMVDEEGWLFIAIYNDQGARSLIWRRIKRIYCASRSGKWLIRILFVPYFATRIALSSMVRRSNVFAQYKKNRGMSMVHDWLDWLGGLPFEVAKCEDIIHFIQARGFRLERLKTTISHGNNQFVFRRARVWDTSA